MTKSFSGVVVLGMHRSGTSVVARALASLGLNPGAREDLVPAQPDNPAGFFERGDVVELNDAILRDPGGHWFDPRPMDDRLLEEWRERAAEIIRRLPESGWLLKDPRMLVTWQVWKPLLESAAIVFVAREPLAVAHSLERRNGFPIEFGLALWEFYNSAALEIIGDRFFVGVSYESLALDFYEEMRRVVTELTQAGLDLQLPATPEKFDLFEMGHDHSSAVDTTLTSLISPQQRALQQACLNAVKTGQISNLQQPDRQVLAARIANFARAYERSAGEITRAQNLSNELDDRRADLTTRSQRLQRVQADYQELLETEAHQAHQINALQSRHNALQSRNEELVAEAEAAKERSHFLFHELELHYENLLSFTGSFAGKCILRLLQAYKLLTLRFRTVTLYEQQIEAAKRHVQLYGSDSENAPPSRIRQVVRIFRYAATHPFATLRNVTGARLMHTFRTVVTADRDRLANWTAVRFPADPSGRMAKTKDHFDPKLDALSLTFDDHRDPLVSIIIPVYNEYRTTVHCLSSLLENTKDCPYEVIIADDCSADLTTSIADRIRNISVVRAETNRGFVRNCNFAAAAARGQYLVFLNNDTAVKEGWLQSLVGVLESDPSVGIVGPKLLFPDGRLQEAGGIIWSDASGWNFGRLDRPDRPEYNYLRETDYVSGACLMIRRDLWQRLGGFDDRFAPAYYEDTDICFAARDDGFKVVYQPESHVIHYEGVSNGTDVSSGVKKNQITNQEKFRTKWQAKLASEQYPNAKHTFRARDRSYTKSAVLIIDHYVPFFDKDAGSRSTWQYVELFLEMGYNVKFLGANFFAHQPYARLLQQKGVEVLIGEHIARTFPRWLKENAEYIDSVYVHRPHIAEQFIDHLSEMNPRPRLIYFGHDLHYLRKQREYEITGNERDAAEARKWRKLETNLFEQVDTVYFPSEYEIEEIRRDNPDLRARAIPLYLMEAVTVPAYEPGERSGMLFVGGFTHPPNLDAVLWLIDEVLPALRRAGYAEPLHIVGSNTPDQLLKHSDLGVKVHGFLSDRELENLYATARMAVVPLRWGAGVKGKVIEAIQHGVPVVTTPIGAEGLPGAESVFHIAETQDAFATEILTVANFGPECQRKLAGYSDYLARNFSKDRAKKIILEDFGPPHKDFDCTSETS